MGAGFPIKSESRKSLKGHARFFGRISQFREIQKVRDFRNPSKAGKAICFSWEICFVLDNFK